MNTNPKPTRQRGLSHTKLRNQRIPRSRIGLGTSESLLSKQQNRMCLDMISTELLLQEVAG